MRKEENREGKKIKGLTSENSPGERANRTWEMFHYIFL